MTLIAAQDDLAPIIQQRITEEKKRKAEIKSKAEQEAKVKAEAEKAQTKAKAIEDEGDQQHDLPPKSWTGYLS